MSNSKANEQYNQLTMPEKHLSNFKRYLSIVGSSRIGNWQNDRNLNNIMAWAEYAEQHGVPNGTSEVLGRLLSNPSLSPHLLALIIAHPTTLKYQSFVLRMLSKRTLSQGSIPVPCFDLNSLDNNENNDDQSLSAAIHQLLLNDEDGTIYGMSLQALLQGTGDVESKYQSKSTPRGMVLLAIAQAVKKFSSLEAIKFVITQGKDERIIWSLLTCYPLFKSFLLILVSNNEEYLLNELDSWNDHFSKIISPILGEIKS